MGGGPLFPTASTNFSGTEAESSDPSSMDRSGDGLVVSPATSKHGTPSFFTDDEESEDIKMNTIKQEIVDNLGLQSSLTSLNNNMLERKKSRDKHKVLTSYLCLEQRKGTLEEAKNKILSYSPGAWIEEVGGLRRSDFELPKTTTLLLVGPRESGKSSLINRISGVFEDDNHPAVRAQVSHDSNVQDGTCFLQEYMIPRNSTSFCLYDTRSLSDNSADNYEMLKSWITKGVRHGELIIRDSDCPRMRESMKCKARQIHNSSSERRMINFVIFVVNGVSVLEAMGSTGNQQDTHVLTEAFSCPYLSFKDAKPVVVVTHGDILSRAERARVRIFLGELLHIPPDKQVFDIPEEDDATAKLSILDMLTYALEHADRNLPCKNRIREKVVIVRVAFVMACFLLIYFAWRLANMMVMKATYPKSSPEIHIEWHKIRHLWS